MAGRIEVYRRDYPARTRTVNKRTGKTVTIPAFYECRYYWNGKEIAWYESRDDVVYLRTDYLGKGRNLSYQERMKQAPTPEMWEDLTAFLSINEDTKLSEYFNA